MNLVKSDSAELRRRHMLHLCMSSSYQAPAKAFELQPQSPRLLHGAGWPSDRLRTHDGRLTLSEDESSSNWHSQPTVSDNCESCRCRTTAEGGGQQIPPPAAVFSPEWRRTESEGARERGSEGARERGADGSMDVLVHS
ncbi:unnamed protein product [Pleuronectes platessa]|uniref:Uncharacterized protein n=1 Tax=Pleuronectes platessa TaxID=8262 RepID=A0A9N7Z1Y8_PLEPL|nr:unnamed protein product [Pleuronectes platessa]